MDKNCVTRHGKRGKPAREGEAQNRRSDLCTRGKGQGKDIGLIRGDLLGLRTMRGEQGSAAAIVVDGVTAIRAAGESLLQGEGPNGRGVE